jgi:DNA-binding SARP family transcriptional activator
LIVLRALGNAEIDTGVATLTPSQEMVFAAALYLILERGKHVSRKRLASLLWPRVAEKARAHRLRQTIHQLKKLGIIVQADRDKLQISDNDTHTDVDELLSFEPPGPFESESFEFLPGYSACFSEPYRDWVDAKREETHATLTRRLVTSIRLARANGDWEKCEKLAVRCRGLDPFNESAVLAHAEASAMRGSKIEALAILDAYVCEVGPSADIRLPASLLRRRITDRLPDRQAKLAMEPTFVGRAEEMKVLIERLELARKGKGGACLLEGEAGIGKTRLSDELIRFAELQNVSVRLVSCKRAESDQPLAAFVDMIPALREMPGALGCSEETLTWLKRLTDLDASSTAPRLALEDSAVVYGYLRRAIFDLLDAIAEERCLLIVVEDVQWLDSASAALFASLVEVLSGKKLMILFNSRGIGNALLDVYQGLNMKILHLSALEERSAKNLLSGLVSQNSRTLKGDDFDWLIDAADGNPFFLQELAKHWLETGRRHEAPPSVATVLDDRLARLSPLACQVLQACAVLGENSNSDRVSRVLECASHDLLTAIEDLTFAGMLRSGTRAQLTHSIQLLPRHDLLSIAVLRRLAPISVSFLHQRCGIVLEQEIVGPLVSTSILRACAFHWNRAGDSERARSLAIKCADHLLEIGLAADAAVAFEAASAYCRTIEAQLEMLHRTVHALRLAREWTRLLQTIGQARALSAANTTMHDDLELIEFDALRRTIKPVREVFARTLVCVYDKSLSAGHRVAAAGQALKLATSRSDLDEMPRIYGAVRDLLHGEDVD